MMMLIPKNKNDMFEFVKVVYKTMLCRFAGHGAY